MNAETLYERFDGSDEAPGSASRILTIGDWQFCFRGLHDELAGVLAARYGGFWSEASDFPAGSPIIEMVDAGNKTWLEPRRGETYRIEALQHQGRTLIVSYGFALERTGPAAWKVALTLPATEREPLGRMVENAIRYIVAETAVDFGGFAVHGAGVLDGERAVIFAGQSGAGKSTAVSQSAPRTSLGDDFAVVVPGRSGWMTAAVPFDNSEQAPAEPRLGWIPLHSMWRLFQAEQDRAERAPTTLASASLMTCVALPWVMPHRTDALLGNVDAFIAASSYGHLRFRPSPEFWQKIQRKKPSKKP